MCAMSDLKYSIHNGKENKKLFYGKNKQTNTEESLTVQMCYMPKSQTVSKASISIFISI